MKHIVWFFSTFLMFASLAHAALTVHIQSPWRDDASKSDYFLHILGSAGGSYNAMFGSTSPTIMTDEGNGWFSYTWNKDVSDFQDWQSFTVSLYPNTADQNYNANNGVQWKEAGEFKMGALFGNDTEVWLYTDPSDNSYTKSYVAPGSKMVWFKSPWGNHALPQMIFGNDSVMMRFAYDDKSSCGWFYGAVTPAMIARNPLQSAHFIRLHTPYMAVPASGVVELGASFAVVDTVFVDGTSADLKVDSKIGSLGACFDSTYVLHVYHPWRSNSTFKDSLVYITVGNNILNNPVAMERDSYPYWFHYTFLTETVNSANWSSSMAQFNIYRRQNEWPQVTYFTEATRPLASTLFPAGVYETWLYTNSGGRLDLSYSPLEPKTIRLMSPWDNMSPMMIVADDTVRMGPIAANAYDTTQSDTCGWYQGTFYKHTDSWDVQFRQSFGTEFYSLEGLMGEDKGYGTPISLDSMVALYDTVWVYPYPLSSSAPKFSEVFPGRLGICPTMKISAMLLDWAGESYDDAIDIDFGGIYGGNAYTTVVQGTTEYKTCGGHVLGMVQDTLSDLGLPLRVDSLLFPWDQCSAGREVDKWFIPETLVVQNGKAYTNATCRDIDLKLDAEGFWLADVTESPNGCNDPVNPGFYPLDDFQYLDSAKTIKNPKFDWDVQGCKHNYSFSMKINAQFKYIKGQYFEFRGDDDVWVFIDNRLAVDIGGCHSPVEGAVDLDTLGLVEGKEYPFQIFFSERNATGSNFKMRTSINLQTQKTYFPVEKKNASGVIEYELLQLLVDESLSCDVSSVTKIDTTFAQSVFRLVGGSLPSEGVLLGPGLNYGGIYISENMAGFSIDTSAFVNSRQLSPGNYVLICYLSSDESQYQMIPFRVPEYPLPDIAFVDVFHVTDSLVFDPNGYTLRGDRMGVDPKNDTLLAHVTYPDTVPIKVVLLYGTTPCGEMAEGAKVSCVTTLNLNTKYPLSFLDMSNQRVTEIATDSTGYAKFYVVGDSAMVDAYFTVEGAGVSNRIHWTDIHFKEPPVPFVVKASMYDVNGDGIPDSLAIPFSKRFDKVVPDTLSWSFGGTEFHKTAGMETIWPLVFKDSIISLYNPEGLRKDVFTGLSDQVYSGSLLYHYTYTDEDSGEEVKLTMNTSIQDKVGPIVLSATIETVSEDLSLVTVNLSEGIDTKRVDDMNTAFVFYRDTANFMDSLQITSITPNKTGNVFRIYFQRSASGSLPAVGDYVRILPGALQDLVGNPAHLENPKVRIVGEQRTEIKSPGVVRIGEEAEPWKHKNPIIAVSVPSNRSVREVVDSLGKPGLLLNFNIGELATGVIMDLPSGADRDSALATIRIGWEIYYFSHLGGFVNKANGDVYCNDSTVFYNAAAPEKSNCYDNPGNVFFEWNARSDKGRLVGTGAYIAKMKLKIMSAGEKAGDADDTYTIGIHRGK